MAFFLDMTQEHVTEELVEVVTSTLPPDLASVINICILEQLNDCVLPVIMKNCGETFYSELRAFPHDIPEACVMIRSCYARLGPLSIVEFFRQLQKHAFDPFDMGFKFLKIIAHLVHLLKLT
jgi:hypothetical protein